MKHIPHGFCAFNCHCRRPAVLVGRIHPPDASAIIADGLIREAGGPILGTVYDAPEIRKAIEEYNVPANQRGRLIAQRRD
jgi:hypothetical protein